MCLAQGHNPLKLGRLKQVASRSQVKHSSTEHLRSQTVTDKYLQEYGESHCPVHHKLSPCFPLQYEHSSSLTTSHVWIVTLTLRQDFQVFSQFFPNQPHIQSWQSVQFVCNLGLTWRPARHVYFELFSYTVKLCQKTTLKKTKNWFS